jgi:hypothetical protein
VFSSLLDTTQHFKPSGKYPQKQPSVQTVAAATPDSGGVSAKDSARVNAALLSAEPAEKNGTIAASRGAPAGAHKESPSAVAYKSSKDVMQAILEYQKKTELSASDIKKERLEVQKLRIKGEDLDEQIRKAKEETAALKKKLDEMHKDK